MEILHLYICKTINYKKTVIMTTAYKVTELFCIIDEFLSE